MPEYTTTIITTAQRWATPIGVGVVAAIDIYLVQVVSAITWQM